MSRRNGANFLASIVIAGFGANFATHAAENVGQQSADGSVLHTVGKSPSDYIEVCEMYGGPDFYGKGLLNRGYIDPVRISEPNTVTSSEEVLESKTSVPSKEDETNVSTNLENTPNLSKEGKKRDFSKKKKKSSAKKKTKKKNTSKDIRLAKKYGGPPLDYLGIRVVPSKISSENGNKISEEDHGIKKIDTNEVKGKDTTSILPAEVNSSDVKGSTESSTPSRVEIDDSLTKVKKNSSKKSESVGDFSKESIIGTGVALGGAAGALYLNSLLKRKSSSDSEEKKADGKENTDVENPSNENVNTKNTSSKQPDSPNKPEKTSEDEKRKDENFGSDVNSNGNDGLKSDENRQTKDENTDEENNLDLYVLLVIELAVMVGIFVALYKIGRSNNSNNLSDSTEAYAAPPISNN